MRKACALSFLSQKQPRESIRLSLLWLLLKQDDILSAENYSHGEEASNDSLISSLFWPFSLLTFTETASFNVHRKLVFFFSLEDEEVGV